LLMNLRMGAAPSGSAPGTGAETVASALPAARLSGCATFAVDDRLLTISSAQRQVLHNAAAPDDALWGPRSSGPMPRGGHPEDQGR
jgi:hypothetical protein